jgi:3-phosphoshikimate 1-carboxyvinyltransferase
MAMAGAVIGLAVADLKIEDIATTGKTLPDFDVMWHALVNV